MLDPVKAHGARLHRDTWRAQGVMSAPEDDPERAGEGNDERFLQIKQICLPTKRQLTP